MALVTPDWRLCRTVIFRKSLIVVELPCLRLLTLQLYYMIHIFKTFFLPCLRIIKPIQRNSGNQHFVQLERLNLTPKPLGEVNGVYNVSPCFLCFDNSILSIIIIPLNYKFSCMYSRYILSFLNVLFISLIPHFS